jgi:alpha/beta superfamily hydrolase
MRAKAIGEQELAPTGALVEPIYFPSGEHKLFGWLHSAAVDSLPGIGLVICNPFGFESMCSHRSVRAFAEAAAEIGVPTLRFDYVGTGDSEDLRLEADQLEAWTQDVVAAISELRRRTGVEQVCLLGFRFGALLATLAAARCESLGSLLVIAPVVSGRRYVRELRTLDLASSPAASAKAPSNSVSHGEKVSKDSVEAGGFLLSAASIAALSQVDFLAMPAPPVAELFVIDRTDLPSAREWTERLSGLGMRTRYMRLPGSVEMLMVAPQFSIIPQIMVSAMRDWLLRFRNTLAQDKAKAGSRNLTSDRGAPLTTLQLRVEGGVSADLITERPMFFGSDPTLFGIVTEPRTDELRRRGVILVNSGGDYHIGPRRLHVSLARQWAQRGYVVLRMDLEGLGDSATRLGRPENEIFPRGAVANMRAAVEFMRSNYAVSNVTLGGLCSGAYHTLRAAVAGLALNRIFMINPQNFYWGEDQSLDDLQLVEIVSHPSVHSERLLSANAWKRLITGRIDIARILRIYSRRGWLMIESSLRDLARWFHISLPNDLGSELEEVTAAGMRVVFVFSRGDVGLDLLRIQGGSAVRRLGDRCRVHIVDGADHDFTRSSARVALANVLSEELFARQH